MDIVTRCHCTPRCLASLFADDDVIDTAAGPALAEHVDPYPAEQLPLPVEVAS